MERKQGIPVFFFIRGEENMKETDMLGTAPIGKLLRKFSVPCITGLLIGALYNIVDQIFIGNSSLGYVGNAATGISFPVLCIANAFAWCIGDGCAAWLSICAGRNDRESADRCVGTGLAATFLISIALMLVSLASAHPLMELLGASGRTLELAVSYFRIVALFFPAYLMTAVMNSTIRSDGSPTFAMVANLAGAALNMILDPICIFVLDWGIEGAAVATVTGQLVSFLVSIAYFRHPKTFTLSQKSFRIDHAMLRNLIVLGGSTFIIQVSMVVMTLLSNVMLARFGSLSKYGPDIPLSVFSIQTKVYTIVNNIAVGIALGGQPILGYNYGAGKLDRVRETWKRIAISSLAVGLAATVLFLAAPDLVIGIFGRQNSLYMEFAVTSFRISLSLAFVTCFVKISSIFFQAIGKPVEAMTSSVIRDMGGFVAFTLILTNAMEAAHPGNGIYGILLASPLSDILAGTVVTILTARFFREMDRKKESCRETADPAFLPTHPGPVITISREHGTCGKQIASLLGRELGIPVYSKELTAIVARESGMAEEFLGKDYDDNDERLSELYMSTHVAQQAMAAQAEVIGRIASRGSCIIVGRAANHVLRNHPNTISIFLHAPEDVRTANIERMYGDSEDDAVRHMLMSDESRAAYCRAISGRDWKDMDSYDLCLDVRNGKEAAVAVLSEFIRKTAS